MDQEKIEVHKLPLHQFDLEKALTGEHDIVTLDGYRVLDIHYFSPSKNTHPLVVLLHNGDIRHYINNGQYDLYASSAYDLRIVLREKEYWVATGIRKSPYTQQTVNCITSLFPSEEEAHASLMNDGFDCMPETIQTHKIIRYE